MRAVKCNTLADEYRDKAGKEFLANHNENALILLNKSLSHSETSDRKMLAFIDRSAIYKKLKLQEKGLENLQLAFEHGMPEKSFEKLKDSFDRVVPNNEAADPWKYFKLTYPAKPRIPLIVDCLQILKDKKFGRGIYTNRKLKAGDIIAIEEPFIKFLSEEAKFQRCATCLKINSLSLIPGGGSGK